MNITILIALIAFVLFCLVSAIVVYFALVLAGRDDGRTKPKKNSKPPRR